MHSFNVSCSYAVCMSPLSVESCRAALCMCCVSSFVLHSSIYCILSALGVVFVFHCSCLIIHDCVSHDHH